MTVENMGVSNKNQQSNLTAGSISFHEQQVAIKERPGVVAESVERRPLVWEIGSLIPGQVKPMTYNVDTSCFLAWFLALIE